MTPFNDQEVRKAYLECVEYLRDDELMSYRDWIQVTKDTAFEVLTEEGLEFLEAYINWVSRLQAELMFLNRSKL